MANSSSDVVEALLAGLQVNHGLSVPEIGRQAGISRIQAYRLVRGESGAPPSRPSRGCRDSSRSSSPRPPARRPLILRTTFLTALCAEGAPFWRAL